MIITLLASTAVLFVLGLPIVNTVSDYMKNDNE